MRGDPPTDDKAQVQERGDSGAVVGDDQDNGESLPGPRGNSRAIRQRSASASHPGGATVEELLEEYRNCLQSFEESLAVGGILEASAHLENSCHIASRLAQQHPLQFQSLLAVSLQRWANSLARGGFHQKALRASEQAVTACRTIPSREQPELREELASCLTTLAQCQLASGHYSQADESAVQASKVLEALPSNDSSAVRLEAILRKCHADIAGRLGQHGRALQFAETAVTLAYRVVTFGDSESIALFGSCLTSLGMSMASNGYTPRAVTLLDQAVDLYRSLSPSVGGNVASDLAASLSALAQALLLDGDPQRALKASQEAAEEASIAGAPEFVAALVNLGGTLYRAGLVERALEANRQAIFHLQESVDTTRSVNAASLATALSNAGVYLCALGRMREAESQLLRSYLIRQELSRIDPRAYCSDLAATLDNLGGVYAAMSRRAKALAATRLAVQYRRTLALNSPAAHQTPLSIALVNLALRLREIGRYEEALIAAEDGIQFMRSRADALDLTHLNRIRHWEAILLDWRAETRH
jgi:tetratricopeptide (TPR) repeat protein